MNSDSKKKIICGILFLLVCFCIAFYIRVDNEIKYNRAKDCVEGGNYSEAYELYSKTGNYLDAKELAKIAAENADKKKIYNRAIEEYEAGKYQDAINLLDSIRDFEDSSAKINEITYDFAENCFNNGNLLEARKLFLQIEDYSSSSKYIARIDAKMAEVTSDKYDNAMYLYDRGNYKEAQKLFEELGDYKDSQEKAKICRRKYLAHPLACGVQYSLGLTDKGNVKISGEDSLGRDDVKDWEKIVSIDGYFSYIIGLAEDGTVKVAGNIEDDTQDVTSLVTDWEDIIDVAAGEHHVVALRDDGRVLAEGYGSQCDTTEWENVVDVDAGWEFTVGLTDKGDLLFAGNADEQIADYNNKKEDWKDVIKISASGGEPRDKKRGKGHTVGLTKDGHVVAVGDDNYHQCEVSNWENIIDVAAGDWYTVGLTEDGKVLITGKNEAGEKYIEQEKIDSWVDIESVAAGYGQTLVLKNDGSVDAMGFEDYDKTKDVAQWGNLYESQTE